MNVRRRHERRERETECKVVLEMLLPRMEKRRIEQGWMDGYLLHPVFTHSNLDGLVRACVCVGAGKIKEIWNSSRWS